MADGSRGRIEPERFHRCWPFHLAMAPIYRLGSHIQIERSHHRLSFLWRRWLRRQTLPAAEVVHAVWGYATEAFVHAKRIGALKVLDLPNSHPVTCHGYWQRECDLWSPGTIVPIPRPFWARATREIEAADLVLCTSQFAFDTLITNGVPPEKCFINPFGVDARIFSPRERVPSRPRFVAVGTISVRKGFQYLFPAFEQVKRQLPDAELIVVGEYKEDFEMQRARWHGTFTQVSHVDHDKLAEILRTASAFVMASVEEGFARAIIEAMAAGLPVVATYESGASTFVEEGVQGTIIPARNVAALASAMLRVVEDPDRNDAMGRAARERATIKNSWQDYGDRFLQEFERRRALASYSKAANALTP
jgi:glycosyltransferase involved in cell wall biosynthesis